MADLDPAERLEAGLDALGIPATASQRQQLLDYLALMQKWNRAFNLTAIRELGSAVDLHLLDSLTLQPYLHGRRILDVGTGAGLPGLPLAVVNTEREFTLLDSSHKKTCFVQQAVIELRLKNVDVVTARVEQYRPAAGFETVLARAFSSLAELWTRTAGLLAPGGRVLAPKGQWPAAEIQSLQHLSVQGHRLRVPGLDAERHLIELAAG